MSTVKLLYCDHYGASWTLAGLLFFKQSVWVEMLWEAVGVWKDAQWGKGSLMDQRGESKNIKVWEETWHHEEIHEIREKSQDVLWKLEYESHVLIILIAHSPRLCCHDVFTSAWNGRSVTLERLFLKLNCLSPSHHTSASLYDTSIGLATCQLSVY